MPIAFDSSLCDPRNTMSICVGRAISSSGFLALSPKIAGRNATNTCRGGGAWKRHVESHTCDESLRAQTVCVSTCRARLPRPSFLL